MPFLSFSSGSSRKRGDWGAMFIYIILVALILLATTFAGGSIALSGINHSQHAIPQRVIYEGGGTDIVGTH